MGPLGVFTLKGWQDSVHSLWSYMGCCLWNLELRVSIKTLFCVNQTFTLPLYGCPYLSPSGPNQSKLSQVFGTANSCVFVLRGIIGIISFACIVTDCVFHSGGCVMTFLTSNWLWKTMFSTILTPQGKSVCVYFNVLYHISIVGFLASGIVVLLEFLPVALTVWSSCVRDITGQWTTSGSW